MSHVSQSYSSGKFKRKAKWIKNSSSELRFSKEPNEHYCMAWLCCFLEVDYKIEDVLVSHLVRTQQFYQLHQLLQFYVITDRQLMACKLLSLHEQYPAAIQLALDMFKRLGQDSHSGFKLVIIIFVL